MKIKIIAALLGATFLLIACGGRGPSAQIVTIIPPILVAQTDKPAKSTDYKSTDYKSTDYKSGFGRVIADTYYTENVNYTTNGALETQDNLDADMDMKAEFASYENRASSEVNYDNNDKRKMSMWTCNGLAPG
ncbi:MAG: hypothetical protein L3J05_01925 [Robiginitomaculum sp.]|nr:hypothetical protein [Robiginitomaculum sp.]